jgi:hypothetical protein
MEQSPSWEANQSLQLVKKFPTFLWNPKVLCRTYKFPPPVPILSRLYSVPTTQSNFLKIHLNIILPSTSGSVYCTYRTKMHGIKFKIKNLYTLLSTSYWILFRMWNVWDKLVGKIKTHNLCLTFFFENLTVLWDNVVNYGRMRQATDDITRRMRCACRIPCYRHALILYNIYLFSTASMVVWTRLNITLYPRSLSVTTCVTDCNFKKFCALYLPVSCDFMEQANAV